MKKSSYILDILRTKLHSENFIFRNKLSSKAFIRNRLLTFPVVFLFILNLIKKGISKELNSFCKYVEPKKATRSAITQARSKLSPQAFVELNHILIEEFYNDNKFKTFQGLKLLVIDSSTIQLPDSLPVIKKYGYSSNQTTTKTPMAKISILFDPLNSLTLDAKISSYYVGERDLVIEHIESLKLIKVDLTKSLIIFDRGYPSLSLIVYLLKNGIPFLMRSSTQFLKEVNEIAQSNVNDAVLKVSLKRATCAAKAELKQLFPNLDFNQSIFFRVVTVILSTGEKEILITSLLNKQEYPHQIFKNLYFKRWGVEEGYKFYKSGVELENFSGKSCLAIEQDFYATVLASNVRALLASEAEEEINNSKQNQIRKYDYSINKKVSMEILKHDLVKILINPKANIEKFCHEVKSLMKQDLVPKRLNRTYKRKIKSPKRKYHMNQR